MRAQGVPIGGNRTEEYGRTPSGWPLYLDIYEPPSLPAAASRPAILYFHAGAFNSLGRELCGGHLAWLATHGVVGLSVSYRLTNSPSDGAGVAGAITDAWTALQWVRANAARLGINPKKVAVWGDSAGGGMALALATGLRPMLGAAYPPGALSLAARADLPTAAIAGYPVVTFGSRYFLMRRDKRRRGGFGRLLGGGPRWLETSATSDLEVANTFVPDGRGATAAAARATLRSTFAGANLFFGQRAFNFPSKCPAKSVEKTI